MPRLLLALMFALTLTSLTRAADDAPLGPPPVELERVHNHPDDAKLLRRFASHYFREAGRLSEDKPDAAEKKLAELERTVETLKPVGKEAEELLDQVKETIQSYRDDIALSRLTPMEVEKAFTEKPDDEDALGNWTSKVVGELFGTAYSRPDETEAKLAAAKAFVAKIAESAKEESTKTRIEALSGTRGIFTQLEKAIEKGREYAALVGKDAAPLTFKTWVNGTPLTAGDLAGKVVVLDFWAVWCGPCIATFPHLREWQEKYADKGLVIIGLTQYYDYDWENDWGYAAKADDEVAPEAEQEMLKKFAAYYHLKHRFAIREEEEDTLADYYGVSGIPHVVVLDKEGKVRMIRVGAGKQNAEDLDKLLAELLK